jgi:hypothetical protein
MVRWPKEMSITYLESYCDNGKLPVVSIATTNFMYS